MCMCNVNIFYKGNYDRPSKGRYTSKNKKAAKKLSFPNITQNREGWIKP